MRVHVINLESSVERRARLGQRLAALGVEHRFFRALDGRTGAAAFESCDLQRYRLNTGRMPSDGEIGCYASHLRLWQRCAETDEPLVVMEDDAEPQPMFAAALEVAGDLIARYGFLRFEYDGPAQPARTRPIETVGAFTAHYFVKYPYGAMCYALSSPVARAFVAASRELRAPVDQFIKRCWEHDQPLYGLLPYTVREGPLAAASTICARTKEALPPGLRAHRVLHKISTRFQRIAFNQRWLQEPTVARQA
jgi:glycosyl transferase family 25